MTVQHDRELFNFGGPAKGLASQVGVTEPWRGNGSDRFAYFADERRFVIVAGPQEGSFVDLAFAQGLEQRGSRRLVLILPKDHAFAILQRAPWFKAEARPDVHLHDGVTAHACDLPTQDETVKRLNAKHKGSPEVELRKAATPLDLGARSAAVYELVEWAAKEPLLDASHRRSERSWHCMGQKVLSIKGHDDRAGHHCRHPLQQTGRGSGSSHRQQRRKARTGAAGCHQETGGRRDPGAAYWIAPDPSTERALAASRDTA
jgi:hypothetical protein